MLNRNAASAIREPSLFRQPPDGIYFPCPVICPLRVLLQRRKTITATLHCHHTHKDTTTMNITFHATIEFNGTLEEIAGSYDRIADLLSFIEPVSVQLIPPTAEQLLAAGILDPDAHLIGTPWDAWRREVATALGVSPQAISALPDAYESFNICTSPEEYVDHLRMGG